MEAILEPLVHSPKLPLYIRQLQVLLDDENAKRQRFYEEITEAQKVEFINGEVVVQSPARLAHIRVSGLLLSLLHTYVSIHGLGLVGHEKMLISLTRNDYEPDLCFFPKAQADDFTQGQWQFPTPEFIVEILSPNTKDIDRTVKFEDYAAHGVGEYWIIEPNAETVEQYVLMGSVYKLLIKAQTGVIRSRVIPGFDIPVRAIFEEQANLNVLHSFLTEHPVKGE